MVKRALVIGGFGYVGEELIRQLLQRGDEITVFDRIASVDNSIDAIKGDFTDSEGFNKLLEGHTFDVIYHLASLPGDTGKTYEMLNVNVFGLVNVLEWARLHPVERVVVTSSLSAIEWYPGTKFCPPDYLPCDENHPCRPKDLYSTSKRMQELLAMTYYHEFQVPTTCIRLTAVIGPGGKGGGRSWRDFARMLQDGKKVQIPYFSPNEIQHFVDRRDVARMQIVLAEHPSAVGEIFSCCSGDYCSGSEFEKIVKEIAPKIEVEFGFPWSIAQGDKLYHSMQKAKRLLGFEPQYSTADAVKNIMNWVTAGGLEKSQTTKMDDVFKDGIQES